MMKTEFRMFRSAGLVSLGTLSSRILGLIREILMASTFGTSGVGSAFFVAFTVPNLFRRLFGEGALSAAFVPHFIHLRETRGQEEASRATRGLGRWLVRWLGTVSLTGIVLSTLLLRHQDPGSSAATTLLCLRILMPYVIGICLAALMMGVLNAHRRYALPAFTPCLLNVIWIGALTALHTRSEMALEEKVLWVSWAILGAGFLQFGVQAVAARSVLPRAEPSVNGDPEVSLILRRMAPAALGAAVTQINVLADRLLAFWVGDFGPAALTYSERLIYLPLGLFATALGTILLPEFSTQVQSEDHRAVETTLNRSLRILTFLMLPAAVGLGLLAVPIVRLVFERGEFDSTSTLLTSRALLLYAPGLLVFSVAKVFVPLFHAHGDTRTPMQVGAVAVVANLALNLVFIFSFPEGWKHAGLAAGTVASVLIQVGILAWLTRKRYAELGVGKLLSSWLQQGAACGVMAAWILFLPRVLPALPEALELLIRISTAVVIYFLSTLLLQCPEWKELRDS